MYICFNEETMARRTKEEAEQTRQAILLAALDLFCEKGYSKTTFDEIAKHINFTKGAVYWHFRNKPDLLIALIREVIIRIENHLKKEVPQVSSVEDLKKYFICMAKLIKSNAQLNKFMFFALYQMEWSETIYKKVKHGLDDILDLPFKLLKETLTNLQKSGEISANVNVNLISEIFICFWKGAIGQEITNSTNVDFIDFVDIGFDRLISNAIEGGK